MDEDSRLNTLSLNYTAYLANVLVLPLCVPVSKPKCLRCTVHPIVLPFHSQLHVEKEQGRCLASEALRF